MRWPAKPWLGSLPSFRQALPEHRRADDDEIKTKLETGGQRIVRITPIIGPAADGGWSRSGPDGPRYYVVTLALRGGGRLRRNVKLGRASALEVLS